jgi:pSer/pThr/pTyr-binding forkhead associated (FHA) protein|tara:strand:+ start:400 stop:696 length:297 start_codon:yes stop_codon:yes gene_type:complete
MKLTISVITGFDEGKKESFTDFPISIGRLPDNDFQLNDPFVSRRHCTIYTDGICFTVSDLKSTNKTILNEKILDSPKSFMDGDNLIIGENLLRLNVDG